MNRKLFLLVIPFFILIIFNNCSNNNAKNNDISTYILVKDKDTIPVIPPLIIHYDTFKIKNKTLLDSFNTIYSKEQIQIIAAINRLDPHRFYVGTEIIIPDTLLSTFDDYSPFPEFLDSIQQQEQLILISLRTQLFAAYENGKRVRFGPLSSGKKSTKTPSGLMYTNFKSKLKISTVNGSWKMPWYFNISNKGGIGLHQYALPGYPASHSCVRLYKEDAKWIYDWAKQWVLNESGSTIIEHGTPVILFGKYDFDSPAPWDELAHNPKVLDITNEEWIEINEQITKIKK